MAEATDYRDRRTATVDVNVVERRNTARADIETDAHGVDKRNPVAGEENVKVVAKRSPV